MGLTTGPDALGNWSMGSGCANSGHDKECDRRG